jgi:hypothetical protein
MNTLTRRSCMLAIWALFIALLVEPASAQVETKERTVKAQPGQDLRIGVFASIRPDCKSGALPTIKLKEPPSHGNVTVKQGKLRTTNFRQCLAVEVPAFVVVYRSKPDYSGSDTVSLEIINADGKTQIQRIMILVGSNPGQSI